MSHEQERTRANAGLLEGGPAQGRRIRVQCIRLESSRVGSTSKREAHEASPGPFRVAVGVAIWPIHKSAKSDSESQNKAHLRLTSDKQKNRESTKQQQKMKHS